MIIAIYKITLYKRFRSCIQEIILKNNWLNESLDTISSICMSCYSFLFVSSHLVGIKLCEVAGVKLNLCDFPLNFRWASDFSFAAFSIFSWKYYCLDSAEKCVRNNYFDFDVVGGRFEELWYSRRRWRRCCPVGICLTIESSIDSFLLLHSETANWNFGRSDWF